MQAPHVDHEVVEKLGSAGFAAKGVLYVVVGLLAASVGLGAGAGGEASQSGAIERLSRTSFGTAILVALAVGLAGYALLRLVHVWVNPSGEDGTRGAVMRASYAVRALVYGGLTLQTVRELAGSSGGGGGERELTQRVLEWPAGAWLVGGAAIVLFGVAAFQARSGLTRTFMEHVDARGRMATVAEWTGAVGHVARAVLFATIGVLLARAALASDASESGGMSQAFQELADTAAGTVLLTLVAAGVVVYGVYCLLLVRWGTTARAG